MFRRNQAYPTASPRSSAIDRNRPKITRARSTSPRQTNRSPANGSGESVTLDVAVDTSPNRSHRSSSGRPERQHVQPSARSANRSTSAPTPFEACSARPPSASGLRDSLDALGGGAQRLLGEHLGAERRITAALGQRPFKIRGLIEVATDRAAL